MSIIWPQLYQHRPGRKLNKQLTATEQEIAEKSRFLCHRYMSRKMRRSALAMGSASMANVKSFKQRTDEHTTLIICQLIETIEQLYPDTYNNISTNLHISNFNERLLCQDFSRFVEELFRHGIKWSLILAYFAFCGGLAEDCVRHSQARLITPILNWHHCFVSLRLSHWIKEQGGWNELVEYFRSTGNANDLEVKHRNRLTQVAWLTATSFKDVTSLVSRKLIYGDETDKHSQKIFVASIIVICIMYVIVMISKAILSGITI